MAGYLSDGTTVFSNISATGDIKASSGSFSVLTVAGTIAVSGTLSNVSASRVTAGTLVAQGGASFSGVTADFRTNSVILSMATSANASTMTTGQLRLVFLASGISLVYSSGASSYVIGQSTQSAAQA